jgi:hypothetical protein
LNPLSDQQAKVVSDLVTIFTGVLLDDNAVETPSHVKVEAQKVREPVLPEATEAQPTVPTAKDQSTPLPPPTYANIAHCKPQCKNALTQLPPSETTTATLGPLQPAASTPSPASNNPKPHQSKKHHKKKVLSSLSAKWCADISASVPDANPSSYPTDSVALFDVGDDTMFWALHRTVINPDTQSIAEYDELSRCSNSTLWIQVNTEEFSQLTQGLGKDSDMPTGTDTIFFIHPSQMLNQCKATYLCWKGDANL